ncbi:hypothetical protein SCLCIDRAFT_1222478 [Scleroderma citrinum Foug A]|uniref:Uncharacterized protein n=1 Tax=Scleroderma citrinum Foug A TaxID=1036808 RepID=A0A0C3DBQ5_9AGAM|nr:hypothetical protein SCLCIDRAFT_1222478 [Scleroderma citrinum Foug A]
MPLIHGVTLHIDIVVIRSTSLPLPAAAVVAYKEAFDRKELTYPVFMESNCLQLVKLDP